MPRDNHLLAGAQLGSFGERAAWLGAEVARNADAALIAFRAAGAQNDYSYLDNAGTSNGKDDRVRTRPNADSQEREAGRSDAPRSASAEQRLTTVFNAFDREQGVTGLAALPALAARAASARLLAGLTAQVPCGSQPGCEIVLTSQAIAARTRLTDPDRELGLLAARLDSQGTRFSESARVRLGGGVFRAFLAANLEFERLALDGATALRAKRNTGSARLALFASLGPDTELSSLAVVTCDATDGPQQRPRLRRSPTGSAAGRAQKVGRVRAAQQLEPLPARAHVGRAVRDLRVGARQFGARAGAGSFLGFGGALEAGLGPLWAYLDVFGFAHLIAYRRSSLGAVQPYNVGSARVLGGELEAGAQFAEHARAALALTVLDPRETTETRTLANDLIPYQSRLFGSLFVEGFLDPGARALRRAGVDARVTHRGSRLADPAGGSCYCPRPPRSIWARPCASAASTILRCVQPSTTCSTRATSTSSAIRCPGGAGTVRRKPAGEDALERGPSFGALNARSALSA